MNEITVYGISSCDVTRKTVAWLKSNNIEYRFHDYKTASITINILNDWERKAGWQKLLNKKGTTWKKISPAIQKAINNSTKALMIMQQQTSLIKRPVIEINGTILIGYDEAIFTKTFLI